MYDIAAPQEHCLKVVDKGNMCGGPGGQQLGTALKQFSAL